jgi:hypothetical protein
MSIVSRLLSVVLAAGLLARCLLITVRMKLAPAHDRWSTSRRRHVLWRHQVRPRCNAKGAVNAFYRMAMGDRFVQIQ